jgi:flagellar motor switch protein FliG
MSKRYQNRIETILENIVYYKSEYATNINHFNKLLEKSIENKIFIISNILDILDRKLYKFFPSKKLLDTKKKLNEKLFNLYIYGSDS